jgi:glucose-6-phosphate 1-dehydrogenase
MSPQPADALVFFGATGDLAYKKIFPALHAMARHGQLTMPVIAVAKSGWTLDQLRARAQESIERHAALDRDALDRLMRSLSYIDATISQVRGDPPKPAGSRRTAVGSTRLCKSQSRTDRSPS